MANSKKIASVKQLVGQIYGDKDCIKVMELLKGLQTEGCIAFNPSAQAPDPGFNASFKLRAILRKNHGSNGIDHKPKDADAEAAASVFMKSRRWYVRKSFAETQLAWWFGEANVDIALSGVEQKKAEEPKKDGKKS